MTLQIENETENEFEFDYREQAAKVIEFTIDYVECPYECEINLTITNNEGIHELNRQYRNVDRPTDVLSFPLVDYPKPCNFELAEANEEDYFNPDTGELMLGDIVLSVEKIKEQAQEFGHSVVREYSFLIVHSMLHLFGFDHMEEDERIVMEAKQKEIMDRMGIMR